MVSRPGEGEGQTRKLTIGQKPAPEFGLTEEQQEANKEEILSRGDDLVFVTPVLEGFALKNKLWRMQTPFLIPPYFQHLQIETLLTCGK